MISKSFALKEIHAYGLLYVLKITGCLHELFIYQTLIMSWQVLKL